MSSTEEFQKEIETLKKEIERMQLQEVACCELWGQIEKLEAQAGDREEDLEARQSELEVIKLKNSCLEDEVELLYHRVDKLEVQDVANKTIIRSEKNKVKELNRRVKSLINKKHPLPTAHLEMFELRTSNLLLRSALRDLITYAGRVVQEAKHHDMHTVINLHMKDKLAALELGSGKEAVAALEWADGLAKKFDYKE